MRAGYGYSGAYPGARSSFLFGSRGFFPQGIPRSGPLLTPAELRQRLKVHRSSLVVPPFRMAKYGHIYICPQEIVVDLKKLPDGFYRIVVVHNFQDEDRNPNLTECLAGIYLARQGDRILDEPECHPVECRSIETIAYLDTRTGGLFVA